MERLKNIILEAENLKLIRSSKIRLWLAIVKKNHSMWGGACSFDLSVSLALAPICQPNQYIFATRLYLDLKCLSVCPCWDKDKAHFKKSNFYILPR